MKKLSILQNSLLLLLFIYSATSFNTGIDPEKEGEKLMQTSRDWSKAASSRDVEKTLSFWADNATLISAGEPELVGKQAIRGMVEGALKNPDFNISWEPVSVTVAKGGDMGYLLEDAKINSKDGEGKPMTMHFRCVTIWNKQPDGTWKNVVDVMSPKAPN